MVTSLDSTILRFSSLKRNLFRRERDEQVENYIKYGYSSASSKEIQCLFKNDCDLEANAIGSDDEYCISMKRLLSL